MATLIPSFDLAKEIGERHEFEAGTLGQLLDEAVSRFGKPFEDTLRVVAIVVNGRSINFLKGRNTPLGRDDTVWMVRPGSGG